MQAKQLWAATTNSATIVALSGVAADMKRRNAYRPQAIALLMFAVTITSGEYVPVCNVAGYPTCGCPHPARTGPAQLQVLSIRFFVLVNPDNE